MIPSHLSLPSPAPELSFSKVTMTDHNPRGCLIGCKKNILLELFFRILFSPFANPFSPFIVGCVQSTPQLFSHPSRVMPDAPVVVISKNVFPSYIQSLFSKTSSGNLAFPLPLRLTGRGAADASFHFPFPAGTSQKSEGPLRGENQHQQRRKSHVQRRTSNKTGKNSPQ